MNKIRIFFNGLAVIVFTLTVVSLTQAQATRTWVSGVGDDANPCSRTAPCKTFAGAISKTATGGEIDALDPGGYGAVTITKAITINGAGTMASILSAGTTGININAPSNSVVVIKNISINGAGTGIHGIRVIAGGVVSVENVDISGCTQHGIFVNVANGSTTSLFVKDSFIRTNNTTTSRGINLQPVSGSANMTAVVDNTRLEGMFVGMYVGEGGRATIRNSVAYGNSYAGVVTEAVSGNAQTNIESCVISHNGIGIQFGAGPTITRISNVTVNNNTSLGVGGAGSLISFGNNRIFGNATDGAPTSTIGQQ